MSRNLEASLPLHPGEILREDFFVPLGLSMNKLALDPRAAVTGLAEILHERRGITPDTALPLARYFNTSARTGSICRLLTISNLRKTSWRIRSSVKSGRPYTRIDYLYRTQKSFPQFPHDVTATLIIYIDARPRFPHTRSRCSGAGVVAGATQKSSLALPR